VCLQDRGKLTSPIAPRLLLLSAPSREAIDHVGRLRLPNVGTSHAKRIRNSARLLVENLAARVLHALDEVGLALLVLFLEVTGVWTVLCHACSLFLLTHRQLVSSAQEKIDRLVESGVTDTRRRISKTLGYAAPVVGVVWTEAKRIGSVHRVAQRVLESVDASQLPNRVRGDVSADGGVIVAVQVVMQPRLRIEVLARESDSASTYLPRLTAQIPAPISAIANTTPATAPA